MKHKFAINYAVFDLRLTWLVFVCLLANWGILLVVRVGGPASGYSLWHYEHWSPDLFSETKFIVTVSWKQAWHNSIARLVRRVRCLSRPYEKNKRYILRRWGLPFFATRNDDLTDFSAKYPIDISIVLSIFYIYENIIWPGAPMTKD